MQKIKKQGSSNSVLLKHIAKMYSYALIILFRIASIFAKLIITNHYFITVLGSYMYLFRYA